MKNTKNWSGKWKCTKIVKKDGETSLGCTNLELVFDTPVEKTGTLAEITLLDGPFKGTYQVGVRKTIDMPQVGKYEAEIWSDRKPILLEFRPKENQQIIYTITFKLFLNKLKTKLFSTAVKKNKKRIISSQKFKRTMTLFKNKKLLMDLNQSTPEHDLPMEPNEVKQAFAKENNLKIQKDKVLQDYLFGVINRGTITVGVTFSIMLLYHTFLQA